MSRSLDAITRVKKSLRAVEQMLEKEPVLVIDSSGKHCFNEPAKDFLRQRGVRGEELLEWIKIGSGHLQKLSWGDICMDILKLPSDDLIVTMKKEPAKPEHLKAKLTLKEREVLIYLVKGLTNKEIALQMNVSPGTINTHLDNIYRKFGCSNRLEACFISLKHGFVGAHPKSA